MSYTPYCYCDGASNCKKHTVQTIEHLEVCDEVSVVPEVEGEDSIMEFGITDNGTTETDTDINSDEKDHDDGEYCVLSNYNEKEVGPE